MQSSDPEDVEVFSHGIRRSRLTVRFDLVPPLAIRAIADRMAKGAEKWGENTWRNGDGAYEAACLNHLMNHLNLHQCGDTTDDHLAAVITNAAMLYELRANRLP